MENKEVKPTETKPTDAKEVKEVKETKTSKASKAKETKEVKTSKETAQAPEVKESLVVNEVKDSSEIADAKKLQAPVQSTQDKNQNNRYQGQRQFNNNRRYQQPLPQRPNGAKPMDARQLSALSVADLTKLAINYNIEDISGLRKQQLIGKIIAVQAKQNGSVYGGGVLEILPDGFGFLRSEENNYLAGAEDIYVSPSQIKRFGLRKGDKIEGLIRPPKDNERFFAMLQVQKVNDIDADKIFRRPLFENLTPLYPNERFVLELDKNSNTQRVIDLMSPIGKGQR
ncbi:MAG: Rho termination factor N-terminal domain-containing protein, partial [Elusimicrobiaceae bacterium]|nr:Rho termination factor N-terminal domain-containing protein [Elusimicrobiaceae bacterium]